jgi:hypothetical protein
LIRSPLCQSFTEGKVTVAVEIYRYDGIDGWALEVIDADGGSTVWQDVFATDAAAMAEFTEGVELLGLAKLIEPKPDDAATEH